MTKPEAKSPLYRLAVFGDPVSHSLSPRIHGRFAQQLGLRVDYQARHVAAAELSPVLQAFAAEGAAGVNLTVPHKQAGLAECNSLSQRARQAGAVNTLIRRERQWHGDNTDGAGLVWDLTRNLGWSLAGRAIVIIGAGGATAGILPDLLAARPGRILIVNRNIDKARALAHRHADQAGLVQPVAVDELAWPEGALLINATSCGHQGTCPLLPEAQLGQVTQAYDLNYADAAKPFLDWARSHGAQNADGLGMLVGQAADSFRQWTGQLPDAGPVLVWLRAELTRQAADSAA